MCAYSHETAFGNMTPALSATGDLSPPPLLTVNSLLGRQD
jgi:hypothetical protein